jgi:hypothetical protein
MACLSSLDTAQQTFHHRNLPRSLLLSALSLLSHLNLWIYSHHHLLHAPAAAAGTRLAAHLLLHPAHYLLLLLQFPASCR